MTNPSVFIVGCPRSGTTLLRRIVDAHPEIAITRETHWIPRLLDLAGPGPEPLVTTELVAALIEHPKFRHLGISAEQVDDLVRKEPVAYARLVTALFDLYGRARGKPLVGDKTPGYVRHLPTLHSLWPEARFVHLIRDGRDVCLSVASWSRAERTVGRWPTYAADGVTTTALWWEWQVRLGREGGSSLPPGHYHEIRYETLVAHPARACEALCAFLGVPFSEAMLNFAAGRTRTDAAMSAKKAWRPVTPGLRDFRAQMPRGSIEQFEAVAAGLLDEMEYECLGGSPPAAAVNHARTVRREFARHALAKDRPLPAGWDAELLSDPASAFSDGVTPAGA